MPGMSDMLMETANHLWQSTACVLIVAILCWYLRRDSARIRYWLWWAASVKFLVPFSLLAALGAWLVGTVPATPVPEAWVETMTVVARPFAADAAGWSSGMVLVLVWGLGSFALLSIWVARAAHLRRALTRARREPRLLRAGRVRVTVYVSRSRIEPGVVGIFRTALLLPESLDERLTPAQLGAVVAHELCHIRRRDNLTAAVHMVVETLFWFHPLVWWIGARLVDERERACDEMVVGLGHDRETYAGSILDVCEHFVASPLRCAAGISGSDLKRRIKLIMRYQGMKRLQLAKKLLLCSMALIALLVPVFSGVLSQNVAMAQNVQGQNGEYLPLVKPPPQYPPRAAQRGLEGEVLVSYTVTTDGFVKDVVVVESSNPIFERAAVESVRKYKYRPRIIDGTPVEVPEVMTAIVFKLEDDAQEANETPYELLSQARPVYPPRAMARGLEGYVVVSYTVSVDGTTKNAFVVESTDPIFDQAAIESINKYMYAPIVIDGARVEVNGLMTRIDFVLDDRLIVTGTRL